MLTICAGGDQTEETKIPIRDGYYSIGSLKKSSSIYVRGVGVSGLHALLQAEKGYFFIEDLESTNGTIFGQSSGLKLLPRRSYQLLDGQIFMIGPTKLQFNFKKDLKISPLKV
jgi:pSer/pThr/pTyr-binding forkhead associated (FHA) protein